MRRPPHPLIFLLLLILILPPTTPNPSPPPIIPHIPVCLPSYGPISDPDALHALGLLSVPFTRPPSRFPAPSLPPFPHTYTFDSALVGLDRLRSASTTHATYTYPPASVPWATHLAALHDLRVVCGHFSAAGSAHPRAWGGWMHAAGFFYVVVNPRQVGALQACLEEGSGLEWCVTRGVYLSEVMHRVARGEGAEAAAKAVASMRVGAGVSGEWGPNGNWGPAGASMPLGSVGAGPSMPLGDLGAGPSMPAADLQATDEDLQALADTLLYLQ
ncbi:hypothetical protein MMC15_007960 [Xylographa vitiligo]|nr:hypothetical protein [Xylographa vitiligo]